MTSMEDFVTVAEIGVPVKLRRLVDPRAGVY